MSLNPAAGQHSTTSSLDIDYGVHDDSLAESFGDLLVRPPDDSGSSDRLKLDEGSTATLEGSLEQSESSPLDNTPTLGLDLDGNIGDTADASQSLVQSSASEDRSSSSLD